MNLFDTWRIVIFGFFLITIMLGMAIGDWSMACWLGVAVSVVVGIGHVAFSFTSVSYLKGTLQLQDISKTIYLEDVERIETWWCYEIGISSQVVGEVEYGQRAHINKKYCFAEFISPNGRVTIYEEIHLGDKFPNNHPYQYDREVDFSRCVKVWDIDKCLETLGFDYIRVYQK